MAITRFKLLFADWRGYLLAFFALVWIANQYMSFYNRLRLDIKSERLEGEIKEEVAEAAKKRKWQRMTLSCKCDPWVDGDVAFTICGPCFAPSGLARMIRRHDNLWHDIVLYIVLKPREFTPPNAACKAYLARVMIAFRSSHNDRSSGRLQAG
jgi:hypothetical protein